MSSNVEDRFEVEYADYQFIDQHTCRVEPVRPSGFEGDVYVVSEETYFGEQTSMLVRVTAKHPKCVLKLGAVYIVPVYSWEDLPFNGEIMHIMHEANAKAEVEGYDEASDSDTALSLV